jgi:hypothetical protein
LARQEESDDADVVRLRLSAGCQDRIISRPGCASLSIEVVHPGCGAAAVSLGLLADFSVFLLSRSSQPERETAMTSRNAAAAAVAFENLTILAPNGLVFPEPLMVIYTRRPYI